MDLNSLRQFLVVARLEHLSHAADELRVAQPSLSRTIARLERELRTPLFDRAGRLRLNDTGKLFRDHVERALGELDAGCRAVGEATTGGFGTVRLASETFLTFIGPLAVFKRAHPGVEVELHQIPAAEMPRRLLAQDVDLCVASQSIHADGLEAVQLLDEAVWLAVPLDHPLAERNSVTVEELSEESFIAAGAGHWQRKLLDQLFAARGLTPRIVYEGDELSVIGELVKAGLGIGLVPDLAKRSMPSTAAAWIAVDDPHCRRTLTLYWGSGSHLSAAARGLRGTITDWNWTANRSHTPGAITP
ncbi:LysR family transcriptional regulator [Nocardia pseudobrasiliensis]|uniref:DNA-binding transcriptional LysR family regulator n=1 Tax=Nocardia pseudobrasiliensis TaxID=45979 RepID=A0A370I099_9NOCA|nr:LysR substrate-binding domain-containing protein [Nocardia pseudobrasiliensis]RDI64158.1 DNA-binding transcriptional LysR family regulator [Nocardia pseudobrasiliensis]